MKWFLFLMTIAIWQCIQVTGSSVSQRKPRSLINPLFSIEYPSSWYRDEVPKEVYSFLPFYRGLRSATKNEPEHATKGENNDKERKPTSHIQIRENNTEILEVKKEDYHVNDEVLKIFVNCFVKVLLAYLKENKEEYRRLEDNNKTSLGESNDKERKPTSHIQIRENDTETLEVKREDYHVNDEVWKTFVNRVKESLAFLNEKEEECKTLENNEKSEDPEEMEELPRRILPFLYYWGRG
ncbi:uncharacterized protein [Linepithema humile]|uniref:uncharacterized protein isoform X2 n=1 Tax=Linepithema humile TaxID=83485 RepID=UPI0006235996|nr:PREDICTED: uncharacterized protein LOC105677347 isoform X2 [Linepithema humile]